MKNPNFIYAGVGGLLIIGVIVFFALGGTNKFFPSNSSNTNNSSSSETSSNNNTNTSNNDRDDTASSNNTLISKGACKYLSASEAQKIMGDEVKETESSDDGCTYTTTGNKSFGVLFFSYSAQNSDLDAYEVGIKSLVDTAYDTLSINGSDKSFWLSELKQLHVLKGEDLIVVSLMSSSLEGKEKEACVEIARLILGRI